MGSIFSEIANYSYKFITSIIGFFVSMGLYYLFPKYQSIFAWPFGLFGLFIVLYIFYGVYRATINTWNDGDLKSRIGAILFGLLGLGFIGLIIYLILFHSTSGQ